MKPRKYSVQEYAQLGDRRVELLEGKVVPKSPHNRRHANRVARLNTLLVRHFGDNHEIRVQLPLTLNEFSEPEPDFALVALEISDASLASDRNEKASLYAKAQIPDYWILNLPQQRLEVRRLPQPDPEAAYGWSYSSLLLLAPGQSHSPLFAPQVELAVSQLLGLELQG